MLATQEAIQLAAMADKWEAHPSRAEQRIAWVHGVEHMWPECAVPLNACGAHSLFPVRLPAEQGVKSPYVSTCSTDPLCSTTATGVWPRHWHDTKRGSALSSAD